MLGPETDLIARDHVARGPRLIRWVYLLVVLALALGGWTTGAVAKTRRHAHGKPATRRHHRRRTAHHKRRAHHRRRRHHRRAHHAHHTRAHRRHKQKHRPTPTAPAAPTASPAAPPPPPGSSSSPQPLGVPGSWRLAFDDEFNSLNLSNWQPNWLGANNSSITKPVNSEEVECIDPAQSSVGGGVLTVTAVQRSCDGYNYASGLLESNGHFNFTYGYMEARMYLPSDGAGGIADWPAFWADGQSWPNDGEIDVMEGLDGGACWHFHYGTPSSPQQVGTCAPGNYSGWHTFGADWEPGSITWYYDGKQVGQTTSNVTSAAMYLIVNLALKSGAAVAPQSMAVDYVRVWQH